MNNCCFPFTLPLFTHTFSQADRHTHISEIMARVHVNHLGVRHASLHWERESLSVSLCERDGEKMKGKGEEEGQQKEKELREMERQRETVTVMLVA